MGVAQIFAKIQGGGGVRQGYQNKKIYVTHPVQVSFSKLYILFLKNETPSSCQD
jgi:hypothetical protein